MTTGALIGTDGTDITEGQGIITTSHAVASKTESNFRVTGDVIYVAPTADNNVSVDV
jgi:hypothetical protein